MPAAGAENFALLEETNTGYDFYRAEGARKNMVCYDANRMLAPRRPSQSPPERGGLLKNLGGSRDIKIRVTPPQSGGDFHDSVTENFQSAPPQSGGDFLDLGGGLSPPGKFLGGDSPPHSEITTPKPYHNYEQQKFPNFISQMEISYDS